MSLTSPDRSADLVRTARERLGRIDQRRTAHRMHDAGRAIDEIAVAMGVTKRDAQRLIATAELLGTDVSATEIILRATATGSERVALVAALPTRSHTTAEYAPYPLEGARRGTWDEVRFAYLSGYLSADGFDAVRRAAAPPNA